MLRFWLPTSVCLGFLILFFFLFGKDPYPREENSVSSSGGRHYSVRGARVFEAPRKELIPLDPKEKNDEPVHQISWEDDVFTGADPNCLNLWDDLRNLDLADVFGKDIKPQFIPKLGGCSNLGPALGNIHGFYEATCGKLVSEADTLEDKVKEDLSGHCYVASLVYRAKLTALKTRHLPIEVITDPAILADRAVANFDVDPKKSAIAAEKLLRADPEFYPAAKLAALSNTVLALSQPSQDPESFAKAKEGLLKAKAMAEAQSEKDYFDVLDSGLELMADKTPKKARELARELDKSQPNSGYASYLNAWADFQQKNFSGAREFLNRAISKAPDNQAYRQTLFELDAYEKGESKDDSIFLLSAQMDLSSVLR